MKKGDLIYTTLLVPIDYLAIVLAGILAYKLRFEATLIELRPVLFQLPFNQYLKLVLIIGIGWIIIIALNGLYSFQRRPLLLEYSRSFSACSTSILIIIIAFFFNSQLFNSRLIILFAWALSFLFVSLFRTFARLIKSRLYLNKQFCQNVVFFSDDESSLAIKNYFKSQRRSGFYLQASYSCLSDNNKAEIESLINQQKVDLIVISAKAVSNDVNWLLEICADRNIPYAYSASLLKFNFNNFNFITLAGLPFIEVERTALNGWGRIYKRFFDIIFSFVVILLLIPLALIIAVIIKLDSPGPVIVKLKRVGKQGQVFNLLKFRSMINNAHALKMQLFEYNQRQDGPLFKYANDPRVTGAGRWLRKTSLDELPQFINVFLGQMSVVGPRPHEPEEVSQYKRQQKQLLAMRPGITGLAQVSGRSDLSFNEEVNLDIYYIEHWHPGLDLTIIFKTPQAMFSPRKAL
jgi:exopolysaccharide biosynthesis polyprenyl glycosylphosphotransferase